MFSKTIAAVAAVVALGQSSLAAPLTKRTSSSFAPISFNNWGGFSSLNNFDSFYGVDNFSGFSNQITVIQQQEQVVCVSQNIEIIQQQLAVLGEFAKEVILSQICEVEVQTIVFSQWFSSLNNFSNDLFRSSGRQIGWDSHVASLIGQLHDSNGQLVHNNLGFSGSSIGSQFVSPSGFNWNDSSSPLSVGSARGLCAAAGNLVN